MPVPNHIQKQPTDIHFAVMQTNVSKHPSQIISSVLSKLKWSN